MTEKVARSEYRGMCGLIASNVVDVGISGVFLTNTLIRNDKKVSAKWNG